MVFDTGQDQASVTDPSYFPSGLTGILSKRLAQFDIGRDQTLTRQLSANGYDVADVRTAVLSHLHQDHIGGLSELHHADIVVSEPTAVSSCFPRRVTLPDRCRSWYAGPITHR